MTTFTIDQTIGGLRTAQDELRMRGWCRFNAVDRTGKICAYEALRRGGLANDLDIVIADLPIPDQPYMGPVARICGFNNHEAQSVEDVIAQFQVTIDRLERERERSRVDHVRELIHA